MAARWSYDSVGIAELLRWTILASFHTLQCTKRTYKGDRIPHEIADQHTIAYRSDHADTHAVAGSEGSHWLVARGLSGTVRRVVGDGTFVRIARHRLQAIDNLEDAQGTRNGRSDL